MQNPKVWSPPARVSRHASSAVRSRSPEANEEVCNCNECQQKRRILRSAPPDPNLVAEEIGSGTFGTIFVYKPDPNKVVKYIIHEYHNETCLLELAFVRSIEHSAFIHAEAIINNNGRSIYIVLPRAMGDLRHYNKDLKKKGESIPEEDLLRWLVQLLDGLNFIHQRGLMHADIKPNNIVLFPKPGRAPPYKPADLDVKFIDFGKARYSQSRYYTKAVTGCVAPPEYLNDNVTWSYSKDPFGLDIWALACTFVDIYTGERLYQVEEVDDLEIVRQSIARIKIDTVMGQILHKMLIPDPRLRPNAQLLLADPLLRPYLSGNMAIGPRIITSLSSPIHKEEKEKIYLIKNAGGYDVPPHDWIQTILSRMRWASEELNLGWDWSKLFYYTTNIVLEMHYDVKHVQHNFRTMSARERNQNFQVLEKINYALLRD